VRIAYVTMQFPVASEAFAAVEIRALCRLGAELSVLAYRPAPPGAEAMLAERRLDGVAIDHGGLAAALRGLCRAFLQPFDAAWLIAVILRHCWRQPLQLLKSLALLPRSLDLLHALEKARPDVVHLFWGHFPSLLGLLVKRRLPDVVVSQFLGAYDLERRFPLSRLLARRADVVLTHTKANLPALTPFGLAAETMRIAYRGVEIPEPLPAPEKTRGLIVVAERLVPQKCTGDAIRVFAAVHRERPEARLVVCGWGPEAPQLKRLAGELALGDAVRFAGHVPHSEVQNLLARAEVALTMSRSPSERLPNVMKEAMLQRCLCLSSRTAGIEELIDDGVCGMIVEPGDVAGAARRLCEALRDPAAIARIGRHAQHKIAADFDVDHLMAERLRHWAALRRSRLADEAA